MINCNLVPVKIQILIMYTASNLGLHYNDMNRTPMEVHKKHKHTQQVAGSKINDLHQVSTLLY